MSLRRLGVISTYWDRFVKTFTCDMQSGRIVQIKKEILLVFAVANWCGKIVPLKPEAYLTESRLVLGECNQMLHYYIFC